jgi:hypothetical protein
MEAWYAFKAYNSQTQYGYGTATEADQYADLLNRNREINVYAPHKLDDAEAAELKLEGNTDAFNLSDALNG